MQYVQGKEKLDERHPWFERCKEWLEYRLNFYLKALSYVDHPDKIKKQSGGKNKEYIEAAMACARQHIAPSRLSQVEKEAKQRRADAAAAVCTFAWLIVRFYGPVLHALAWISDMSRVDSKN